MAKGQGLPLSFIVIAAISALILVLIIAFTVGGLGGFFKQITISGGGDDLSTTQSACTAACNTVQTTATTLNAFKNSAYCKKTYAIDLDKNGKINTNATLGKVETKLTCGGADIGVDCTVQLSSGDVLTPDVCAVGGYCTKVLLGACGTAACKGSKTAQTPNDCATGSVCCA